MTRTFPSVSLIFAFPCVLTLYFKFLPQCRNHGAWPVLGFLPYLFEQQQRFYPLPIASWNIQVEGSDGCGHTRGSSSTRVVLTSDYCTVICPCAWHTSTQWSLPRQVGVSALSPHQSPTPSLWVQYPPLENGERNLLSKEMLTDAKLGVNLTFIRLNERDFKQTRP